MQQEADTEWETGSGDYKEQEYPTGFMLQLQFPTEQGTGDSDVPAHQINLLYHEKF